MSDAKLEKYGVEVVKHLQRLKGSNDDDENYSGSGRDRIERRKTVFKLDNIKKQRNKQIATLDVAFKKRFFAEKNKEDRKNGVPGTPTLELRRSDNPIFRDPDILAALEARRTTVVQERRKSTMRTLGANNEYAIANGTRNHRNSQVSIGNIFGQGHDNASFIPDDTSDRNSLQMKRASWNNNNLRM